MPLLTQTIASQTRDIGFPVRRLLPTRQARRVGPFVFLDHMGPAHFAAEGSAGDVRPHPHIGLATVTYLFSGAMMHRDSLGTVQRIEPGAVNLMTAGSGITHSERVPADIRRQGAAVEGMQLWLALPDELEECEPAFAHYPAEDLPRWEQDGVELNLLMGEGWGRRAPVAYPLPVFYASAVMQAGARLALPEGVDELAAYVAAGELDVDGAVLNANELGLLRNGQGGELIARRDSRVMLLGGTPPASPRYLDWNFVSSRRERLAQARADWIAQRFPMVPGETEFIPLQ
ncbi:pirin family protein [Chromobacterium piscinae]|uniref:pirin family protein n=1 Tax=Chromobacterium piscinae TaxID=686831 RepID=UPI001C8BC7C8|nr:pirin family protein [Chromobacterium piscinae]MBX9298764.1 pirin family protein [Chromobacterium vaccinii]MBX9358469.1 pirin family protein [Chromobacterium vaccinii]MCD4505060.1 pirin family protein [Chromobacterium piscinae]MCD5326476.1 pirin family protein [Chromobacterium piscinae]